MPGRKRTPTLLGRSLAHYRVLGQIGKGGMGEVYAAEDQRLRRRVALKVLSPEMALEPRRLERFQREARSVAALNHPNIVTIYSVEEAKGLHFLVLELVEGETLADLLAATGPMSLDRLLAIARPLTEALEAAHARGIIHRDLKPRNIMVSREGRVKILDFGIARLTRADEQVEEEDTRETGLTQTGGIIGTTSYMSPEQVQGRPVDRRSDLFSLGIVLYEMATGRHPFRRKSHLATMAAILCETPPPPRTLAPELPARFDEIVNLCLAKEPFLRYRGVAELRKDFQALESETETTLASPAVRAIASLTNPPESSSSAAHWGTNHRLPARPRCFGRETEVGALAEAICSTPPPPVPVLGPAGAGKTTIALTALHDPRVANLFGKRRWFIRCDGATERESLVGAIARVICPEAIPPLEPKILLDLEEAPAVLVLDNFETPWERDTAAVEELLTEIAALSGVALVVALRGEQRPFGPSWREAIHAGPLNPESARTAFLAVAGERYRDDPDLNPFLSELDGLALAVVLLAGQAEGEPDLSMLRLRWQERRTTLLRRAGARDCQQSLEISLGLSIDSPRMDEEGRRLLSILGLLPEGAAREDLESLLPGDGAEAAAVLRKVGLVFDQGSRLRMLAPVREHVKHCHPPWTEDFDRVVDHYLTLARLGEKIGNIGGAEAAQRLRPEVGNLELMILAGLERYDPVPAIHTALAYADITLFTGQGSMKVLARARSTAQQKQEIRLAADCVRKQAEIDSAQSHSTNAQEGYEQALALYRKAGNRFGEGACTMRLGDVQLILHSDPVTAIPFYEEALSLFRALDENPSWEGQCLMGLGAAAVNLSDYASGRTLLERARTLFQKAGDARNEANCLQRMGQSSFELRDYEQAKNESEAARSLFQQVGSLLGEANSLRNLGYIAMLCGDAESSWLLCSKALALSRRVGSLLGEANCLFILGEVAIGQASYGQAEKLFQDARLRFQRIGQSVGVANCMESLGQVAREQEDDLKALFWFKEALASFEKIPQPNSIGRIHLELARSTPPGSLERLEHIEAARRVWEEAGLLEQLRSEFEAVAQSSP